MKNAKLYSYYFASAKSIVVSRSLITEENGKAVSGPLRNMIRGCSEKRSRQ